MSKILYIIISLSLGVLVYWFLPKRSRSIFLLAASLFFMSFFSIKYTLYFLLIALSIYFTGIFIQKEDKNKILFLKLALFFLIGNICVFKYIDSLLNAIFRIGFQFPVIPETTFSKIAIPMGMSYIIFRLIHYVVEIYRKTLPAHTFWDLALYVFFFPTFLAGPVDRFQRFQPQTTEHKSFESSDINYGLLRIVSGMIKKFIIADHLKPLVISVLSSPQESLWAIVVLAIYGLAIQIYMDFSGYTDMAVGVARLFGYKIMENFNYPYFKKNIALFWRNWHISVYSFIRDYFFFPFFGYRASRKKIYIGIFITMIVFMLWHEASLPFLFLGIYHGSGLVLWQGFQELKGKHGSIKKMVDNKYLDPLLNFLTFSFVSFSFIFFSFDMNAIKAIFLRIF